MQVAVKSDRSTRRVVDLVAGHLRQLLDQLDAIPVADLGLLLYLVTVSQGSLRPTLARPSSLSDHLRSRSVRASDTVAAATQLRGDDTPHIVIAHIRTQSADLLRVIDGAVPAVVESMYGPVKFVDFMRGLLIELIALNRRHNLPVAPMALAEAVRSLASVLGERYGGKTIEIRVPPYAAVQLAAFGEGPTHTRGTPPNVIETSPDVFFALASGERHWDDVSATELTVSGAHAGLVERMLPVVHPAH